jgi:hypothetical protein
MLDLKQFYDGWPIEKSSQVHPSDDKNIQLRLRGTWFRVIFKAMIR